MHARHANPLALLVLACALVWTGCDSGGDDAAPAEELSAMFADLQSALTLALTPGGFKALDARDCPQGGQIDVTSTGGTSGINSTVRFLDCNGIDGELSLSGSSSFSGQVFNYDLTIDGQLQQTCDVTYDAFRETISTNIQSGTASVIMNGAITADCSSGSVQCSFNDVEFDPQSASASLFEDSCS